MTKPHIIAIEGIAGVGKSTLAAGFTESHRDAIRMRLPDSFRAMRETLDAAVNPTAHLGHYLAATTQLGTEAADQTATRVVVLDRYFPSPMGLFMVASPLSEQEIATLSTPFLAASPVPSLTVILTAAHAEIRTRLDSRPSERFKLGSVHGRCRADESFALGWQSAIEKYAGEMGPTITLDTTNRTEAEVRSTLIEELRTGLIPDL